MGIAPLLMADRGDGEEELESAPPSKRYSNSTSSLVPMEVAAANDKGQVDDADLSNLLARLESNGQVATS